MAKPQSKREKAHIYGKISQKEKADYKLRYAYAKRTSHGASHKCPVCQTSLNKKRGRIFCSNSTNPHEDGSNCKDAYYNAMDTSRLKFVGRNKR